MKIDEFNKWLKTQPLEDKIVCLKYKYSFEDKWTYSNEYLEVDTSIDGCYCWLYDWDEGQQDVEILGCIDVSKLDISLFVKQAERRMTNEDKLNEILRKTFPNTVFPRSVNFEKMIQVMYFTEEWLHSQYKTESEDE